MNAHNLAGRSIVITGASSGFGRGAALAFAQQGARLTLAARRGEVLGELVAELRTHGCEALSVPTDVGHAREMAQLAAVALENFGRIDVWVNNAGVGAIGPFERIPLEDHVKVIETNLLGTLYGTYYAYRQFLEQGAGTLINIASELGAYTVPYYASYAAAKHGVVGLDEALQQEIEQAELENVHVCTLLPTAHDTPFFEHAGNYSGHATQPGRPLHDPQDVVDAIVRLALDPKNSEIVGADGAVKVLVKRMLPGVARKMAAKQMHKVQIEDAPPAADTAGAVQRPVPHGTGVRATRDEHTERAT